MTALLFLLLLLRSSLFQQNVQKTWGKKGAPDFPLPPSTPGSQTWPPNLCCWILFNQRSEKSRVKCALYSTKHCSLFLHRHYKVIIETLLCNFLLLLLLPTDKATKLSIECVSCKSTLQMGARLSIAAAAAAKNVNSPKRRKSEINNNNNNNRNEHQKMAAELLQRAKWTKQHPKMTTAAGKQAKRSQSCVLGWR